MKHSREFRIDFVVSLCKLNILFPSVIEALVEFYNPRTIYILTSEIEIHKLQMSEWKTGNTKICYIKEETFFLHPYQITLEKIKSWYSYKDIYFQLWYHQIMKLGIIHRIKHISSPFVLWDANLVPMQKWTLYPSFCIPYYHHALLSKKDSNPYVQSQHTHSIQSLLRLSERTPTYSHLEGGTFHSYHFICHPHIIHSLIQYIEKTHKCTSTYPWFRVIMELSHKYTRFSEYKLISTFMSYFYPKYLKYHSYLHYGIHGIQTHSYKSLFKIFQDLNTKVLSSKSYVSHEELFNYFFLNCDYLPTFVLFNHPFG